MTSINPSRIIGGREPTLDVVHTLEPMPFSEDRPMIPYRPLLVSLLLSGIGIAQGETAPLPPDAYTAVDAAIKAVLGGVVEDRRHIHANPELGEREHETAALVAKRLESLGLSVQTGVGKTGVVGILDGGRPGGVVAYRADLDALPITEKTDLPFASNKTTTWAGKTVGVMHACGHDVHVAVGLGVAAVLARPEVRKHLRGSVKFIFQPAEEGVPEPGHHGADLMVREGVLKDPAPTAIFGLHCNPSLPAGKVAVRPGGSLAAVDRFTIDIKGKQTHGAYPHKGVDSVLVASHIVVALQSIAARSIDTLESVVVTVGKIEGGNRYNIIPETAQLVGTIRTHDEKVQARVHDKLERIAKGVASGFGAEATIGIKKNCPVTWNHEQLTEAMRPTFLRSVGSANLATERPHMGGEDFAFFAKEIPGVYYWLGVGNQAKGYTHWIHTPYFRADEDAIPVGMRTSALLLLEYLATRR